jgi:putative FmdB family regulatory protein
MPTYEFQCPNGHEFEKFFRTISGGASELPCPVCASTSTRKISAGAGLMFKGSGFYITDYGKDGKKDQSQPRKTASGGEGSSSSASDGGSGESKSSDSKSGESKPSDSKPAESKSAEPKPAAQKTAEPKASTPKSSNSSE